MGKGVRTLKVADQLPHCDIVIGQSAYRLEDYVANKRVIDVGCGFGDTRSVVERLGGTWEGVEPFPGGSHTMVGTAEALPVPDGSFDVVIMDAVLEHVQNPLRAFSEVARVLVPGGFFIGYVAFMECFHEISYCHISFKALEHFSETHGMRLRRLAGGNCFGIDYNLQVLLYPLPVGFAAPLLARCIRTVISLKAHAAIPILLLKRGLSLDQARAAASAYYRLECLRQSVGFTFVIQKDA